MSCGAASANDIAGARWRVAELGGEAVSNAGALEIRADRITGREACNRIAARYTAADGRLTVGPVRATRMTCPFIALETRLVRALERARAYRLDASRLVLLDENGAALAGLVKT